MLGCLLEKQRTTPDAYPLSLNALRLACNQSTNRDPVVEYDDSVLRDALHRLGRRRFTRLTSGAGSRAPKYRHLLDEALPMRGDEQAILCVLMLRGPQTPGELKQRADRMHVFEDLEAVGDTLERLAGRDLAVRLERRPGQKEERYRQLVGQSDDDAAAYAVTSAAAERSAANAKQEHPRSPGAGPDAASTAAGELEARVARLEREVAELREALGGGGGS